MIYPLTYKPIKASAFHKRRATVFTLHAAAGESTGATFLQLKACDVKDGCWPLPRPLPFHFYAFFCLENVLKYNKLYSVYIEWFH